MVTLGTKCPSMTSTCSQSAEAATSPICSASCPKSAERMEGAMRMAPKAPASRRPLSASLTGAGSAEPGPAQNAPEAIEVRLALPQLLQEQFAVAVDELFEELGGEPAPVRRE